MIGEGGIPTNPNIFSRLSQVEESYICLVAMVLWESMDYHLGAMVALVVMALDAVSIIAALIPEDQSYYWLLLELHGKPTWTSNSPSAYMLNDTESLGILSPPPTPQSTFTISTIANGSGLLSHA